MMTFKVDDERLLRVRQAGLLDPDCELELLKAVPDKDGYYVTEKKIKLAADEIKAFLANKMGIELKGV